MKSITKEEAIKTVETFGCEEDFICANIERWISGDGEVRDNSIELSEYWRECKSIAKDYLF